MNAEDCITHREFIDQPGSEGIYYPWICSCSPPMCSVCGAYWSYDQPVCIDMGCPSNEGAINE